MNQAEAKLTLGWREWVALPELGMPAIKAKVDTGARTSALHARSIQTYRSSGVLRVRFELHPLRGVEALLCECTAEVIDRRKVTDSGGHAEMRYFISSEVEISGVRWPIEISLTRRSNLRFRMLLGRRALAKRCVVDPARSYCAGRIRDPARLYSVSGQS